MDWVNFDISSLAESIKEKQTYKQTNKQKKRTRVELDDFGFVW